MTEIMIIRINNNSNKHDTNSDNNSNQHNTNNTNNNNNDNNNHNHNNIKTIITQRGLPSYDPHALAGLTYRPALGRPITSTVPDLI